LRDTARARPTIGLVVPYTSPAFTARALAQALQLAEGLDMTVTLMGVHVLPYPTPLECQEGIRQRCEAELAAVARTCPVTTRVKLAFARNREEAYLVLIPRESLVVIGVKESWWKTGDERLARRLAEHGRTVAIVYGS